MAYIDLIILAAVAAFLGYRLWSVLGTHDADKPIKRKNSGFLDEEELPIRPTHRAAANVEEGGPHEIFDQQSFLRGAEEAFRMIVDAFAKGDKKQLRPLLSNAIFDTFSDAIDKRNKKNESLEVDLFRIVQAEIIKDIETKGTQEITVQFLSEQCSVTRDEKDKVISGKPDVFHEITDIWTFAREKKSANPNWILVSTEMEEGNEA